MKKITAFLTGIALLILTGCSLVRPGQTPIPTPTSYPFLTATTRPTHTPIQPSDTPQPSPTIFIPTHTPTPANTPTPSHTPTATSRFDPTPTIPSDNDGPCTAQPDGVFGTVYEGQPSLPTILGCMIAPPDSEEEPKAWQTTIIYQPFERGHMVWLSNVGWITDKVIYVMLDDEVYTRHDDTFNPELDPESSNLQPPPDLFEPVRELGKVWRTVPGLQTRIGFATAPSTQEVTQMVMFVYGEMVHVPAVEGVFVFKRGTPNTWLFFSLAPTEP